MVSDYGLLPVKKANDLANENLSGSKQRMSAAAASSSSAATNVAPVSTVAGAGSGVNGVGGQGAGAGAVDRWTAPEVAIDGEEHTPQSDLFSYGGVLYEVSGLFSAACLVRAFRDGVFHFCTLRALFGWVCACVSA